MPETIAKFGDEIGKMLKHSDEKMRRAGIEFLGSSPEAIAIFRDKIVKNREDLDG